MTGPELVALIAAIAAAIVSIITAWRGEATKRVASEASAMAADASAMAEEASLAPAPEVPMLPIPGTAIPGANLWEIIQLGEKVLGTLSALNGLAVGEETETPIIKTTYKSKRFDLGPIPAKRTK